MTKNNDYELEVDMWDQDWKFARAKYGTFRIEAEVGTNPVNYILWASDYK